LTADSHHPSVPRPLFLAGVFIALSVYFIAISRVASGPDGKTPPPPGDTQDYDNIALQILHGRGFALDYSDPEWRRAYVEHNEEGIYDEILSRRQPFKVTTYRPPLLPFALALTYRVFGRNFFAWRVIESLMAAAGLALACAVAWRTFGPRIALIAAGVMAVSASYAHYIAYWGLMTEPLAAFAIALLVWSLSHLEPVPRYRMAVLAGFALAFLCLSRSFYIVWTPVLAVLVWWVSWKAGADRRRAIATAVLFVGVAVALQIPWWIRNCRVTGALMPFGTQAGIAMHTAYSDLAVSHRGIWWWAPPRQYENAYVKEIGRACVGCDEVALARYGMRGALVWAVKHPGEMLKLAGWKVSFTWMLMEETGVAWPMFWLALAAPLVIWRRRTFIRTRIAVAILAVIILNFGVIASTWSTGWRFLVPVEPLLAILVAVALGAALFGDAAIEGERFA
jgi:4-amino-4-deoxy-L-arabinose transferase-like glycosyltransferase